MAAVLTDSPASTRAESTAIPSSARSSSKPRADQEGLLEDGRVAPEDGRVVGREGASALALVSVAEAALAGLTDSQAFGKGTPIQQRVPSFKPGAPQGAADRPAAGAGPEPKLEGGRKPSASSSLGTMAANSDRDTDGADAAPEPPPRRPLAGRRRRSSRGSRPASPAPGSRPMSPVGPDVTARSSSGLDHVQIWAVAARPARDPPQGVRLGRRHLHPLRGGVAAVEGHVNPVLDDHTSVVGLEDDRRADLHH